MPKLNDTQLMLLSKATQQDGLVVIPPNLKGAAATKVIKPLIARDLVNEVPSKPDTAWRRDEAEGQSYALMITDAGRAAINAEEDSKASERPRTTRPAVKLGQSPARAARKAAKRKRAKQAGGGSPRASSKLAKVIGMLISKAGTTIEAIVKATGWLPHTTRAALTGLRKRGYRVEKEPREGGRTIYRIVGGAAPRKPAAKKRRKGR
jgi:Protein of unknown function (DUF3489)